MELREINRELAKSSGVGATVYYCMYILLQLDVGDHATERTTDHRGSEAIASEKRSQPGSLVGGINNHCGRGYCLRAIGPRTKGTVRPTEPQSLDVIDISAISRSR